MNTVELFRELNTFYQIRGDNYGRKFISEIIQASAENKVQPVDYESFYESNRQHFHEYNEGTIKSYLVVLRQFVRYVTVVDDLANTRNRLKRRSGKKKIKIYDSYYKFRGSNNHHS